MEKWLEHVMHMLACGRLLRPCRGMCRTSYAKKFPFFMSLESLLCLLPSGAMVGWLVTGETFYFPLFSLSSPRIPVGHSKF